jgi:hypothetical protein
MSSVGAAPSAAVPVPSARAEASRRNGAKLRVPKTPEGKARAAQNALKHGLRAQKYVVLPEENADEFAGLEAALIEELAPVGARRSGATLVVALGARRADRARAARRGRRLAARAGGPVGRRNGVGAPFPNPAANRPSCSRSVASRTAASGSRSLATATAPGRSRRLGQRQHRARWSVRSDQPPSRRGLGRVLARPAHAQGAPGRAGFCPRGVGRWASRS